MSARDAILSAIRAQRVNAAARPAAYRVPSLGEDGVTFFIAQATRAAAEVRRLGNMREVPGAIAEALRNRNMKAVVHFPEACGPLRDLPWDVAPGLLKAHSAPGPDDAALSLAPYAIAETGTHQQLLAQGGTYARLYEMQFADTDDVIAPTTSRAPGAQA